MGVIQYPDFPFQVLLLCFGHINYKDSLKRNLSNKEI